MTTDVRTVTHDTSVVDAARMMLQDDIGNVLVTEGGKVCGILTDRDIVIRGIARECDPKTTKVADVCTHDLVTLEATATVEEAKKLMADRAVRRLPVVENGRPVGIVSLGDVAMEDSGERALEEISAAPANN